MYQVMYYGGMAGAFLFFIASVVLFIRNDVWKLLGDVTGWNARRAIKKLDRKGAESTSKTEAIKPEVSKVLVRRATTTGSLQAVTESAELTDRQTKPDKKARRHRSHKEDKTALLQSEDAKATNNIFEIEEEMMVLAGTENTDGAAAEMDPESITTLLSTQGDHETTVLADAGDEEPTDVLAADGDEEITTRLVQDADNEITTKLSIVEGDDEVTMLLSSEGDDEVTTLLVPEGDDEATTLLSAEGDDEATTLLKEQKSTDISWIMKPDTSNMMQLEPEMKQFEPVLQEDEELMELLHSTGNKE